VTRLRFPRRAELAGVALPAVLGVLSVAAAAASDVRTDMETLGLALDNAVLQVSRPSRIGASPRGAARGYRIAGFGAMFVLSPRQLPVPKPPPTAEERDAARALSEAAEALARRLPDVDSEEVREQLRQDARSQRRNEIDLRMREKTGRRAAGEPDPSASASPAQPPGPRTLEEDLQQLEQDVQVQLRLQSEAARMMRDGLGSMPPDVRAEYERQMRELHDQAEAFRQRVERRRAMTEQSVLITLGVETGASGSLAPSGPVTTISMGTSPSPLPAPPVGTSQAALDEGPPVRPWTFWTTPPPEMVAEPGGVVRNVGIAIARVLETQGGRLVHLPPQESVAVAVDFIPATTLLVTARPARTLLVRVRKADIDARAAGLIDTTEFTKRVEVVEY
jgi:hypothetical protein